MNLSPELQMPYSIEGFLSDDEVQRVITSIDAYKAEHPTRLTAGAEGITIHQSGDLSVPEIVAVYEPKGRLDINIQQMPKEIIDIMEEGFYRRIEDIRRAYPQAVGAYGFTYVEYAVNQYFTPHIDGVSDLMVAGFGVTLTDDFDGGEFFVETCGSNRLWMRDQNEKTAIAPVADASSEWYRSLPKTQWLTKPKRGNAIFYGSALTHGSKPVTHGVLKKVLAFIRR